MKTLHGCIVSSLKLPFNAFLKSSDEFLAENKMRQKKPQKNDIYLPAADLEDSLSHLYVFTPQYIARHF